MTPRDRRKSREQERLDELLSAYLDGQLAGPERSRLEARLAEDAQLRSQLEALRHTVGLLGELPTLAVPRNFILARDTAAQARSVSRPITRRPLFAPVLTAATSAATLLFGIVLAAQLMLAQPGGALFAPANWQDSDSTPAVTGTPIPHTDGEGHDGTALPLGRDATAEPTGDDQRYSTDGVDAVTPSPQPTAEPGAGGGGEPPAFTATAAAPMAATDEDPESGATPTPAAIGAGPEEAELPVMQESDPADTAGDLGGETPAERLAPTWVWYAVEVCLGVGAVVLGGASVWAWRARRR